MDLYEVLDSNLHNVLSDYHSIDELLNEFTSEFGDDNIDNFTEKDIQTLTGYIFDDNYIKACAQDEPRGLSSKILWDNISEYYSTLHLGDGYVYDYFNEEDYDSVYRLLMDRLYVEYASQIIYDIVKNVFESDNHEEVKVELSDEDYDEGFEESTKKHKRRLFF